MILEMRCVSKAMLIFVMLGLAAMSSALDMPLCAIDCMSASIKSSPCIMHDTSCICANAPLQSNLTACIQASCTVRDGLSKPGMGAASSLLSVSMGMLEFLSECFAISNELVCSCFTEPSIQVVDAGYGRDIWTISFSNVTLILKYNWVVEMLYVGAVSSIKLAFLSLYLHIFPNHGLRSGIYITMGIVVAYFIAFFFGTCLNCLPVSYIWTSWTNETRGNCLNFNAFGIACAVLNIVLDVVVMALPLRELARLKLRPVKKNLVMLMFCTGFFITIVSIIRLKSVVTFAHTSNATYDFVPVAYWSLIESYTAVICVSMPAMRRLSKRLLDPCIGIPHSSGIDPKTTEREKSFHLQRVAGRHSRGVSLGKNIKASVSQEPLTRQYSDGIELADVVERS
ncbi:Nucleic acid-bindingOB-fold [Penicillium diatomitis]|uniref:Nucleic acid-bindingOB-fold n=1 Tax=Penicillium diatomitis TaxID=2819901 RepID=A0A9W9XLX2_9EURO|nr:Nucleic acid-bindingOB-fold [Penicillium diatomitis]KAJ5495456.1 Nucleic acid-bindingOB-fold [Penicillium diatomitis]